MSESIDTNGHAAGPDAAAHPAPSRPAPIATATRAAVGERHRSVTELSIGEYLIRRLGDYGIRHVFGVPGDYVLHFYDMLAHSPLELVNCTREDCAGYAADAYAR
ncbi:MAG: thiamine pyrophosphate-binding protein, partial [Planctomycetia bacterium]